MTLPIPMGKVSRCVGGLREPFRERLAGSKMVRAAGEKSPQARGRELASQGKKLWAEMGSVKDAARELMSRHRDVPCLQAYRYACGLSQDQAGPVQHGDRPSDSIGGTSINAWETWARGRGTGSPPPFSASCCWLSPMAAARWESPRRTSRPAIWSVRLMNACRSKTRCRCGSSPRDRRRDRQDRRLGPPGEHACA